MQGAVVWLPARLVEPGSTRAAATLQPGSTETSELDISGEPDSLDVVVSLLMMVLVYD